MPYVDDDAPQYARRPSAEASIWRYVDFAKFVDLLDTASLFFARADHLGDRYEGSYVSSIIERLSVGRTGEPLTTEHLAMFASARRRMREWTFVSCWHVNPRESAAMWRLYLKSDEGIAIRSTFGRLTGSFSRASHSIHAGLVTYIDYDTDDAGGFSPFMTKRASFAHENELRAVISDSDGFAGAQTRADMEPRLSAATLADVGLSATNLRQRGSSCQWTWRNSLLKFVLRRWRRLGSGTSSPALRRATCLRWRCVSHRSTSIRSSKQNEQ